MTLVRFIEDIIFVLLLVLYAVISMLFAYDLSSASLLFPQSRQGLHLTFTLDKLNFQLEVTLYYAEATASIDYIHNVHVTVYSVRLINQIF